MEVEIALKRNASWRAKKNRLIDSVMDHFKVTHDKRLIFRLDGQPFDLEFCDDFQTWKIRCVPGPVSPEDREAVKQAHLNPAYFRKAIAYRAEDGKKTFDLIKIE